MSDDDKANPGLDGCDQIAGTTPQPAQPEKITAETPREDISLPPHTYVEDSMPKVKEEETRSSTSGLGDAPSTPTSVSSPLPVQERPLSSDPIKSDYISSSLPIPQMISKMASDLTDDGLPRSSGTLQMSSALENEMKKTQSSPTMKVRRESGHDRCTMPELTPPSPHPPTPSPASFLATHIMS